jgi:HPt (histidine-containing phosphotransfer) domain-containing protein
LFSFDCTPMGRQTVFTSRTAMLSPRLTVIAGSVTKNLGELSRLGHFLKGSSATLGFTRIKDSCQVIQQYGNNQTIDGAPELDDEVCFDKVKEALETVKEDKAVLEKKMHDFFRIGDVSN